MMITIIVNVVSSMHGDNKQPDLYLVHFLFEKQPTGHLKTSVKLLRESNRQDHRYKVNTLTPVSYTHLDVYKRQYLSTCSIVKHIIAKYTL